MEKEKEEEEDVESEDQNEESDYGAFSVDEEVLNSGNIMDNVQDEIEVENGEEEEDDDDLSNKINNIEIEIEEEPVETARNSDNWSDVSLSPINTSSTNKEPFTIINEKMNQEISLLDISATAIINSIGGRGESNDNKNKNKKRKKHEKKKNRKSIKEKKNDENANNNNNNESMPMYDDDDDLLCYSPVSEALPPFSPSPIKESKRNNDNYYYNTSRSSRKSKKDDNNDNNNDNNYNSYSDSIEKDGINNNNNNNEKANTSPLSYQRVRNRKNKNNNSNEKSNSEKAKTPTIPIPPSHSTANVIASSPVVTPVTPVTSPSVSSVTIPFSSLSPFTSLSSSSADTSSSSSSSSFERKRKRNSKETKTVIEKPKSPTTPVTPVVASNSFISPSLSPIQKKRRSYSKMRDSVDRISKEIENINLSLSMEDDMNKEKSINSSIESVSNSNYSIIQYEENLNSIPNCCIESCFNRIKPNTRTPKINISIQPKQFIDVAQCCVETYFLENQDE